MLLILGTSFLSRGDVGELTRPLTLENYRRLVGFGVFGFESLYPLIILRSLALGALTAILCLLAGLPLAFFIAGLPPRWKGAALTLVVIPFWTNLLIRTYAWQILLSPDGWITRIAVALGTVESGAALYPGTGAVLVAMVCDYLPFMVLPLYASVEKLDWTLAEAAADLGARAGQVFRHALLPQIRPGIAAGVILVFLPATGQFVIPDLLGGARTVLLGNAVQQQFGPGLDWPFGAAIAALGLATVLAGVWLYGRVTGGREEVGVV
ncbi:MAG: ABC transporter permease [Verrucomicrobia bacterium]|nr:ABC transporter permease [Verrucomicrobiota bacterium]